MEQGREHPVHGSRTATIATEETEQPGEQKATALFGLSVSVFKLHQALCLRLSTLGTTINPEVLKTHNPRDHGSSLKLKISTKSHNPSDS